jgi:hypothetical protein
LKTEHPKIFIGKIATYSAEEVSNILSNFQTAVAENSETKIRTLFNYFLPEAKIAEKEKIEQIALNKPEEKFYPQASQLGLAEK